MSKILLNVQGVLRGLIIASWIEFFINNDFGQPKKGFQIRNMINGIVLVEFFILFIEFDFVLSLRENMIMLMKLL